MGRYLNRAEETSHLTKLVNRATKESTSDHRVLRPAPTPKRSVTRLSKAQNARIVELYAQGARPAEIASEIGTSEWTIHHRLNKMQITRRPMGMSPDEVNRAVKLRLDGMSYNQLGPLLGYSPNTVCKEVRKRGIN